MATPYLPPYFSEHTLRAIFWTLIHSLWIGLISAALAGLVIALGKKMTAKLRYRLLCGILFAFVLSTSFVYLMEMIGPSSVGQVVIPAAQPGRSVSLQTNTVVESFSLAEVTNLLNRSAGYLLTVWLLFFAWKSIKLTRELLYVRNVRMSGVPAADPDWAEKVSAFCKKLGIPRAIILLESGMVQVPVTIGYLKPVILLPAGMLLQLSPGQIESILWHELAHILRRDYLVNIMQSIVETIFFFNPAVLWLSTLVREEREICCDDIVLEQIPQKRSYLEALMAFQDYEGKLANYAMGLSFRRNQLMDRLRRMVNQENKKLNAAEKIVLLSGIALLSFFTFVPKANSEIHQGARFIKKQLMVALHVTAPVKNKPVAKTPVLAPAIPPREDVTTSSVDTTARFTSILFNHTSTDRVNREMEVSDNKGNHYVLKVADDKLTSLEVNGRKIPDDQLSSYQQGLLHRIDIALDEKKHTGPAAIAEFKAKNGIYVKKDSANFHKEGSGKAKMAAGYVKAKDGNYLNDSATYMKSAAVKGKLTGYVKTGSTSKQPDPAVKRTPNSGSDFQHDRERVRGIIAALVQEKVIPDAAALDWFGLSDTEFIVNGNKQPLELQQRLKAQYGVKQHYGLYYGPVKMSGEGVFVEKGEL